MTKKVYYECICGRLLLKSDRAWDLRRRTHFMTAIHRHSLRKRLRTNKLTWKRYNLKRLVLIDKRKIKQLNN